MVGGGPAGIEAARVGVQRGFDVTLWEASDRLGGNLWPAAKPDFKRDIADYITYLTGLAGRLPIDIVLNKRQLPGISKASLLIMSSLLPAQTWSPPRLMATLCCQRFSC